MAAYVIVDVDVVEPKPYQEYVRRVPPTIARDGGRFLIRGGRSETLAGHWQPQRIVVIEFPSIEQAKAWYASPEYADLLQMRRRHARTNFLAIVEGV